MREEFKTEIDVVEYLLNEYKNELNRGELFNNKIYWTNNKSRLKRLRQEINSTLINIERSELAYCKELENDLVMG